MTHEDHVTPRGSAPRPQAEADRHGGFVFSSALLASIGVLVAGWYGVRTSSLTLQALALDMALGALAAWLSWSAQRIRRGARDVSSGGRTAPEMPAVSATSWGDARDGEPDEAEELSSGWDWEQRRGLHYLFLALVPTGIVCVVAARRLWTFSTGGAPAPETDAAVALGLVCLAAGCVWLALAKSYTGIAAEELPDSGCLSLAFRDLQWASVLAAAGLVGNQVWPAAGTWAGCLLLTWVLLVGGEQLARAAIAWLRSPAARTLDPLRAAVREAVLLHNNPVSSLFSSLETHFGVSFRSSWAIRFVCGSLVPAALLVVLTLWGLSSLAVVRVDELGVRESFGRVADQPLPPGLNWKLPWPFGRVLRHPVKQVFTRPIGFVSEAGRQDGYLWTQKHAREEFALVLGDGAELVAVGALVYYKIHEDTPRFLDYVYHCQNPDEALEAYAYRALMEQTRAVRLRDVLTANRAQFAEQLQQKLCAYAEANRLGIEVIDVALIGLHPPVEAASDYLQVISARIDAERFQTEALGKKLVSIVDAERESGSAVASAQAEASRRVGEAMAESAEFVSIGAAYAVSPDAFTLRLWIEALEGLLEKKRFVLVDKTLASGPGGILLDQRTDAAREDPVPFTR